MDLIPTVDKYSDKPFLPEMPEKLLHTKQGSFVPFLMGTNRDEGSLGLYAGKLSIIICIHRC